MDLCPSDDLHMMAALLRGATIDTILSSFTCEGSPLIRDALVIPATLDDALVARLGRTPDEWHRNWMLFHFLSYRASEAVFAKAIQQFPDLLPRTCWETDLSGNDPQLAAYARAHHMNVLPDHLRMEAADSLESAAVTDLDVSFFGEQNMLALIPPLRLVGLGLALRATILPSLDDRIDEIAADADLNEEPDSQFKKLLDLLDRIEAIGTDADATALIDGARDQVKRSIKALEERKRERGEASEDETDWTHIVTQKKDEAPPSTPVTSKRSVFDDVDK
jgi:hypothetical protein